MADEPSKESPRVRNGILQVPAAALQKASQVGGKAGGTNSRSPPEKLKVIIRRLPPGLTQLEFETALGEEWILGKGRVDYFGYTPGKISDKKGRPSAAVLHLTNQIYLAALLEKVRQAPFTDAKNTTRDSCLLGPPTVEFALYQRIPNSRQRHDPRQGTIDQDPEFQAFLQELTNPITKPVPEEPPADGANKTPEKITTTPLIESIREKKAAKTKTSPPAAQATKHARQDSRDNQSSKTADRKLLSKPMKDIGTAPVATRKESTLDKAAKDAVKVLTREASKTANKGHTAPSSDVPPAPRQNSLTGPAAERKRERGSTSAVTRMLQRDLGLHSSRRSSKKEIGADANKANGEATTSSPLTQVESTATMTSQAPNENGISVPPRAPRKTSPRKAQSPGKLANNPTARTDDTSAPSNAPTGPSASSAIPKRPAASTQPPTGPAASRNSAKPSNNSKSNKPNSSMPSAPSPSSQSLINPPSAATQAFLKHANPSQGITEPLLLEAFAPFGPVSKVEIDKRKGFAYVDFEEPASLQKAIKASPVKVAQGSVQVLERKLDRAPRNGASAGARGGRGAASMSPSARGGRGGKGGKPGAVRGGASSSAVNALPAANTVSTPISVGAAPSAPSAGPEPDAG